MENFNIEPVSRVFGYDRGKPIDRYYIEKFLECNRSFINGHVLEIGDNAYTTAFGQGITKSDVLNLIPTEEATIVGNLETGENVPEKTFDCIILTQVIHVIFDIRSALNNTLRALKPGGVLLLTTAGISPSCRADHYDDYWRFTTDSLTKLLLEFVPQESVSVEGYGNIAVAKAFLDGFALHEVPPEILDHYDENFQVLLTARIIKPK